MCETGTCPVEAWACDPTLTEFVTDYLVAKSLRARTEDPRTQAFLFEKWGLYEDPYLLLELEAVYAEWMHQVQQQQKHSK